MTIRARRRPQKVTNLANMSESQLAQIWMFGNLVTGPESVTFIATPEEQEQAGELFRKRRAERQEKGK